MGSRLGWGCRWQETAGSGGLWCWAMSPTLCRVLAPGPPAPCGALLWRWMLVALRIEAGCGFPDLGVFILLVCSCRFGGVGSLGSRSLGLGGTWPSSSQGGAPEIPLLPACRRSQCTVCVTQRRGVLCWVSWCCNSCSPCHLLPSNCGFIEMSLNCLGIH